MIDASVLRILHYEGRFPNVPASERIGRKAIIDEITAPVPCESPFFQVPDGALFFFLQTSVLEILTRKMLKAVATNISAPVTKLFNLSISTGMFPNKWKVSSVVPIPKSADKRNPGNYRPISLLPVLSKLLERHIFSLLSKHLDQSHPISDSQWGFQAGKSTTTALLETTNNWFQLLESGREVGAVFFDFRKAFDSVPHRLLLRKLEDINLHPLLLRWIHSYLSGRTQKVVVNGAASNSLPVYSGVPQGSVIGPLLFLIYIDGIKSLLLSRDSHLTLFADDMLLYRPISCQSDFHLLQQDVNKISDWVDSNYLHFNVQKCKFMLVSRKIQPDSLFTPQLHLCGQLLERVPTYKYLGLLLSDNLSWTQHVKNLCTKARKILGLVYRRFYQYSSSESLFQMYISLVRPNLEYASQVWSPYKVGEINSIEGVQKFALRMCAKNWDANYEELLQLFSVPNMQQRRAYLDLCSMFRIIHGLFHFPDNIYCHNDVQRVTRSSNPHSFICPFARTCYYYNSYVPRSIRLWNSLPTSLTNNTVISSISLFKSNIRAHVYH